MWLQLKFSLFGREIFTLDLDRAVGYEEFDDEDGEDEEEEDDLENWSSLRWGEHPHFERIVFSPLV